jgi:XapX domain-containing protein
MKIYVVALAAGILVGLIYGLLHVRSPAPPVVALVGLLGILIGEQIVPLASRVLKGEGLTTAWFVRECVPKITGTEQAPPVRTASADPDKIEE